MHSDNKCAIEQSVLFDLEAKISEPNANPASGVLIGSANTQRARVTSDLILRGHVHLTSCFDFNLLGEQDSVLN